MLRLSMLLSCIFMTNTALDDNTTTDNHHQHHHNPHHHQNTTNMASNHQHHQFLFDKREVAHDFEKYAVTCYICVNVSDNLICNQYAIDRPCKPGETFCHTLHIMDSKGTSVLVNKKCTNDKECQRNKVGCIEIDSQKMCVSCCDQNYCNMNVPTNSTNAIYDDKITKMRMLAKNLFTEREKAMTTTIKHNNNTNNAIINHSNYKNQKFIYLLLLNLLIIIYYQHHHRHYHL